MSKIPSSLNQKSYLQKYLGGPSGDKKKKKKKAVKGSGLKIIDDDIDLSKLRTLDGDELDVFDQGEDAPQIAGIIDDRPEEVKKAEQFSSSSKWKIINQDDGFNSKLEVEEIKSDVKQAEKENELIFGKMYSDSEDEKKNDSDLSPPRKQEKDNDNKAKVSKSSKKHDSDNDFSPHRKRDARSPNRKKYDQSPKRRDDRSNRSHNGRSPNERHDNSAKRRDDRSPKKRSDPKTKSVETSAKKRDDRSPNDRHEKSFKRKNDISPDHRKDKSTKRIDDKRKHDDRSPKRSHEKSPKRRSHDRSPKRKNDDKSPKRRNDDRSPIKERSNRNDTDIPPKRERIRKPSRWGDFGPEDPATLQPSTSEHSPRTVDAGNSSPPRRTRTVSSPHHTKNYDSDASPPRKCKKNYDSDQSPPRKSKKSHDSPSRKSKKDHASNLSSPRRSKGDSRRRNRSPEFLSPSKKLRYSPQRQSHNDRQERYQSNSRQDKSRKHRHSSDSDLSPPRRNRNDKSASPPRKNRKAPENNKRRSNSDSDQSPPRREKDRNTSERDRSKRPNDSPPPSNKKMAKTLEGKLAGLQDARQLRHENESFRKREEEVFNKMTDDVSGRNAQVVSRKSKRETSEEKQKLKEKVERQKELDEKYKKWTKGIKQLEDQEARVQEFLHESSKPLARLRDDRDLEDNLKQVERAGDPMLKYMRDRKRERGELGPEKPIYKGQFPPNRFNIRPGYRWDGVDRSNGYENKYFDQQSKRKAQEEEAYKWSTEDL